MRKKYFYALVPFILSFGLVNCHESSSSEKSISQGKQLFATHCISCHGLEEDGFGPQLGGITKLLTEEELIHFINNPSEAIASEAERAVWQYSRYKQIMPSYEWLGDDKIKAILSYINQQTELHDIQPIAMHESEDKEGLSGNLVSAVETPVLKIELEEIIQISPKEGSSASLGIVTLRPHPSKDGSLFVSDQNGYIYSINDGKAEVFLDIKDWVEDYQHGPGLATGLGSFDFHPDFLNNGLIYILHAETYKGQIADYAISDSLKSEVQWVLSEWKMDDVSESKFMGSYRELLRLHAPTFAHGAQDLGFVPDLEKNNPDYGLLYFGYGDGGSNNIGIPSLGHHPKSFLGSIMRIDPLGNNSKNGNYGIPDSNPFANEQDPLTVKEIYAFGFRNPHRMAWDVRNSNRMIVTDIGESNLEEINILENGMDYGWPNREGNYGISTTKDLKTVYQISKSDLAFYEKPYAVYDHQDGYAISGGYVYEGDLELLKGKYVFGDIVNGKLFYTNMDDSLSDSTIYELAIFENSVESNLQEMSNTKRLHLRVAYDRFTKEMYVITKSDGKIRRIVSCNLIE